MSAGSNKKMYNYESELSLGSLGSASLEYKENNMPFSVLLEAHSHESESSVFQRKEWISPSNAGDFHNRSNSSQESPFKGLDKSPFSTSQKHLLIEQVAPSEQKIDTENLGNMIHSSGRTEFTNLYDITFEENSSNAVDIKLYNRSPGKAGNESHHISDTEQFVLKLFRNEKSPDLFGNDDNEHEMRNYSCQDKNSASEPILQYKESYDLKPLNNLQTNKKAIEINKTYNYTESLTKTTRNYNVDSLFRKNCQREEEILQRIKKCLEGLPPPPSVTTPQLDLFSAVLTRKDDILNYFPNVKAIMLRREQENLITTKNLLRSTHSLDKSKLIGWREVLGIRQHGFCFNLCTASESIECLALSIIERFVGCETTSSYHNSPSSAKKRNTRMKLITQSPGNRLSHLARRRATFSSAHLATTSQKTKTLLGHQILMDKKKNKHRKKCTPKRIMSGSKKQNRKTPSSSNRKRIFHCDLLKLDSLREASKRALFQSPPKNMQQEQSTTSLLSNIKPVITNRIDKSKRALFSPETLLKSDEILENEIHICQISVNKPVKAMSSISNFQTNSVLKRKRDFKEENYFKDLPSQSNKLFREGAENLTPRALKIKSQSFCIGADTSSFTGAKETVVLNGLLHNNFNLDCNHVNMTSKIQRTHSEMVAQTNSLTENQRKKLLWAVSQALQEKKISTKHESFKQYAAVLARIVRRLFQEYFQKNSTSNSETMLRLAKRYVHNVINGNNADDIYLQAKAKIGNDKLYPNLRLSGYIGREEYERQINSYQQKKSTLSSQHVNDINEMLPTDALKSQSTLLEYNSLDIIANVKSQQEELPIQSNASLQNSSSKNNICGLALRENLNFGCEQRRSEQKNFTGKDQRNMSPYAASCSNTTSIKRSTTISKKQLQYCPESSLLSVTKKVKRQIIFDN